MLDGPEVRALCRPVKLFHIKPFLSLKLILCAARGKTETVDTNLEIWKQLIKGMHVRGSYSGYVHLVAALMYSLCAAKHTKTHLKYERAVVQLTAHVDLAKSLRYFLQTARAMEKRSKWIAAICRNN